MRLKDTFITHDNDGEQILIDEFSYRLYSHIWVDFFFIRRPVLYLRDRIKNYWRKKTRDEKEQEI